MNVGRAPAGCGAPLARGGSAAVSQSGSTVLTVGVGVVTIAFVGAARGLEWWVMAPIFLVSSSVWAVELLSTGRTCARAGRGWFASNGGQFVRTDALTELRVRVIRSGTYVSLLDAAGRHVDVPLAELTADSRIWGLVLADVQISVASGLDVHDDLTARTFNLETQSCPPP